jgi:hypothetical protein
MILWELLAICNTKKEKVKGLGLVFVDSAWLIPRSRRQGTVLRLSRRHLASQEALQRLTWTLRMYNWIDQSPRRMRVDPSCPGPTYQVFDRTSIDRTATSLEKSRFQISHKGQKDRRLISANWWALQPHPRLSTPRWRSSHNYDDCPITFSDQEVFGVSWF